MEVGLFSRQCLGKRRIEDIAALRKQARAWNRRVNKDKATIQWKFTRRQARTTLHYTITRSSTRQGWLQGLATQIDHLDGDWTFVTNNSIDFRGPVSKPGSTGEYDKPRCRGLFWTKYRLPN